jgi:hypothetical protein
MNTFTTPKGTQLPFLNIKGKDYLQVMHRMIWFREECPKWGIQTEFLRLGESDAVARATIRDEQGNIVAQATKSETHAGFADFIEKAESGAIGRALGFAGFGTQFAQELDEGERIVDSPAPSKVQAIKAAPDQIPSFPAPAKAADGNAGAFVMPFGKYKGMTLEQMGAHGVDTWRSSILRGMEEKGEQPKGTMVQVLAAVDAFLASRTFDRNRAVSNG